MPYRRADAEYLREKARQFRRLAIGMDDENRRRLYDLANELEVKADEVEQRPDPRRPI
jgi:hypothetical protein